MKPLVIFGDVLLDVDIEGTASRLSPEAPVPVVDIDHERHRPGGAGLAALLAARAGEDVVLVTAVGADETGRRLAGLLGREMELMSLPLRGSTVRKTRVRAGGQSLVRVDTGGGVAADDGGVERLRRLLSGAGAVLVADYGRGVAALPGIRRVLADSAHRMPVVWDPHPSGPAPVEHARLVTPNEAEARTFAGPGPGGAEALAANLRERWAAGAVAVTVGARGAVLAEGDAPRHIPPPPEAMPSGAFHADTCGAGDRFAAAAAAALREGADNAEAVGRAVTAATAFVAEGGAAHLCTRESAVARPVDPYALAARLRADGRTVVATGGCFDLLHAGHIALLDRARSYGDALIVCVNSDASVRALKGPQRPIVGVHDRVRLLAALQCVDAVAVFDEPSPAGLLDRLRPDVWVKGGDYREEDLPEAATVRAHGGRVAIVPTVAGYSTTGLVAAISGGR